MLYLKKSVVWLKGCFTLVGVVSFFSGVYSLALVDLFFFAKEITAPAFSAVFTGGALMLACYTALKVNKWLNNKINEKAFKQTEKILEYLEDLQAVLEPLRSKLNLIETGYKHYGFSHLNNEQKNDIYNHCNDITSFADKLIMSTLMLKYWNSTLTASGYDKIGKFDKKLRELIYSTAPLIDSNSDDELKSNISNNKKLYVEAMANLTDIFSLRYDDMFTHNVTSLSKKATE